MNRLRTEVDRTLREEQAGFRPGRSCNEQIFTLRNIIEQSREFNKELLVNFVDFRKAFDSINRDTLWNIVRLYGVPEKYINIFRALFRDASCCIRTESSNTIMFQIETGVRQGCVLSPFLFALVIDYIMKRTMDEHLE